MSLAALQAAMIDVASGRQTGGLGGEIRAGQGAPAAARLDAYRDVVAGGHLAALGNAYPVLREVLGAAYFDHLLTVSIDRMGSADRDINRYGVFLPDLLDILQADRPELGDLPYLADLARLEWAVHESTLSCDDPPGDWSAFAAIAQQTRCRARLRLSRALRLLAVYWPVDHIWASHRGHAGPDAECAGTVTLCVHRTGRFDAAVTRVDEEDGRLLERIACGASVADLERTGNRDHDDVVRTIMDWIGRGWIAGHDLGVEDVR